MKKDLLNDQQLVTAFQRTNSHACFGELYNRYKRKVYKTCLSVTKDSLAAQDYTQDIFIRVFHKLDRFQNNSSFSTWLYAISYRYCLDQLRINKRLKTSPLSDELENGPLTEYTDANQAEWIEWQYQIWESRLQKLPTDELTMLRLKYQDGLSVKDISEQYNLSESAVKMRLKRSRDRLNQDNRSNLRR